MPQDATAPVILESAQVSHDRTVLANISVSDSGSTELNMILTVARVIPRFEATPFINIL